jgi:hypothetical protein
MQNGYRYEKGADGKAFWLPLLVIVLLAFKSDDDDLITYLSKLARLILKATFLAICGGLFYLYIWRPMAGS